MNKRDGRDGQAGGAGLVAIQLALSFGVGVGAFLTVKVGRAVVSWVGARNMARGSV